MLSNEVVQLDTSKNLAFGGLSCFTVAVICAEAANAGFRDMDERYARLSEAGDPMEKLNAVGPMGGIRQAFGQGAEALRWRKGRPPGRPTPLLASWRPAKTSH